MRRVSWALSSPTNGWTTALPDGNVIGFFRARAHSGDAGPTLEDMAIMTEDRALSPFGRPSKERRDSAAAGRTCAEDKCETVLSRYNNTELCGVHEPRRMVPATRKSK